MKKKVIRKIVIGRLGKMMFLSLFTIYQLPFTLNAAFFDTGFSARGSAMGGAYSSLRGNSELIFYNPAGLSGIANPQLSCYYHKPFAGLSNVDLNSVAASFALPVYAKGSFGLGYIQFNAGDSEDKLYQETSVSASMSYKVNSRLFAGFTMKQLSHRYIFDERSFSLPDETFAADCSASAVTADAGLNLIFSRTLNFGISYQNFLTADVGIYDEDIVPPIIRFGSNFTKKKITIALDYDVRAQRWGDKTTVALGGEWRFSNVLSARAGYNKDEKAMGFGLSTLIFGEDLLTFNYAYCIPSQISGAISHRLSISLRHGKKKAVEKEMPPEEEEKGYRLQESEEIILE